MKINMIIKMLYRVILFCAFTANVLPHTVLAKEDVPVSVRDVSFSPENFFELSGTGFDKEKVHFNKGWIGVFMENEKDKGILVVETTKGSPAEKAGMKTGEIITTTT